MGKIKHLVIIGSGPAAYTAAIYAARAKMEVMLFEGGTEKMPGGQLMTTTIVENFPGFSEGIDGSELMQKMKNQAEKFETKIFFEDVKKVNLKKSPFIVYGVKNTISCYALIIATGAEPRKLNIPGVKELWQKGVSTCAVCDGAAPIFRGKVVFVVGGGDSAAEEALFLTKFASKVFMVHRKDHLKASKVLTDRLMDHPKIQILWNQEMIEIFGKSQVEAVALRDVVSKKIEKKEGAGVFFAIGHDPNTSFLENQIKLNEQGYILTDCKTTKTSVEGVFAAGDVQDLLYRQAVTAAGTGCMAALDAEKWLSSKGYLNI